MIDPTPRLLGRTATRIGLALCGAVLACGPAAAAPGTVFLTTYLRAGPGEGYAALDEIAPHSVVEVEGCEGGWCRIRSGRASGFIRAEVLSARDIHAKPESPPVATCFTVRMNGRPDGGDDVRICGGR